jgi:hypothetical protein
VTKEENALKLVHFQVSPYGWVFFYHFEANNKILLCEGLNRLWCEIHTCGAKNFQVFWAKTSLEN